MTIHHTPKTVWPLVVILLVILIASAGAFDNDELKIAFETMRSAELDLSGGWELIGATIEHHDLMVQLDSGVLYLYQPIRLNSVEQRWGGLFVGRARFQFKPRVEMERVQLERFFGVDSLSIATREIELLFGPEIVARLIAEGVKTEATPDRAVQSAEEHHRFLTGRFNDYQIFQALRGIGFPNGQPFLLVNASLSKYGQSIYKFDPYASEEISFSRFNLLSGTEGVLETICQYSMFSDGTSAMINGLDRTQLAEPRYSLVSEVDSDGNFENSTFIRASVQKPLGLIRMNLSVRLMLDSITLADSSPAAYWRWQEDSARSGDVFLFLDRLYQFGDSLSVTVYSHGDVLNRYKSGPTLSPYPDWYANLSESSASYELEFRTPRELDLVVSALPLTRKVIDNTLITGWNEEQTGSNMTFKLGRQRLYEQVDPAVPPIEIYQNPGLPASPVPDSSASQVVASELINCLKLFTNYFGPYQHPKVRATEFENPGSSDIKTRCDVLPGLIRLAEGLTREPTFTSQTRMSLAHEISHQWWGGEVEATTYHDEWLTEGLGEYSAMLFVQGTEGNQAFFGKLAEAAVSIFANKSLLPGSGLEYGPIALGYRTASSGLRESRDLIAFKKAAWVLHMLRNMLLDLESMSDDTFLEMMREWYRAGKGRKVTTRQFKNLTDRYVGEDMTWFFDQFIYRTELPTYHFSYELARDSLGRTIAECHIEQEGVPDSFRMYVPLEIEFVTGEVSFIRLLIDQPIGDITLPPITGVVKQLRLNPLHSVLSIVKQ